MIWEYKQLCERVLAIPVITGAKSQSERFAGALDTLTVEGMMQNGWALQCGTSHFLGQNFAKAFDVTYATPQGTKEYVWATSWGVSTRLIGAMVMSHGDDVGVVFPPAVAPVQVVVMQIGTSEEAASACVALSKTLRLANIRCVVDSRGEERPGKRFFEWERKGVPVRIEVGPKDVSAGKGVARSRVGTSGKASISLTDPGAAVREVQDALGAVHDHLFATAQARLRARTVRVTKYAQLKSGLENRPADSTEGPAFFMAPWAPDDAAEAAIKADCKATIRCYPRQEDLGLEHALVSGEECFYSGRPATTVALFARAF